MYCRKFFLKSYLIFENNTENYTANDFQSGREKEMIMINPFFWFYRVTCKKCLLGLALTHWNFEFLKGSLGSQLV